MRRYLIALLSFCFLVIPLQFSYGDDLLELDRLLGEQQSLEENLVDLWNEQRSIWNDTLENWNLKLNTVQKDMEEVLQKSSELQNSLEGERKKCVILSGVCVSLVIIDATLMILLIIK